MKFTRKCLAVLLAVLLGVTAVPGVFAEEPLTGAEQTVQTGDIAQPDETNPADSAELSQTEENTEQPAPSASPEVSPEPETSPEPESTPEPETSQKPESTSEPEEPAKPETPVLVSVQNVNGGVEIRWGKVEGAVNYRVFYKTANSGWKRAGDTAETSFVWTKGVPTTKYTFTVRCVSSDGKAYESNYDRTGISIKYMLQDPASIEAQNVNDGVKISWGTVGGASKYRVFRKNANGKWTRVGDTTGTSFVWTKAVPNTTYTFTVRCLSRSGKTYESGYDKSGVQIRFLPYGTPQLSGATNADGGAKISWKQVSGASVYRVYYKNESGKWKKIDDTTGTSYLWKDAVSGKSYTFTVRCLSADRKHFTSDYDSAGVQLDYLAQPKISSLTVNAAGVKIKWNQVGAAKKYRVYAKSAGTGWRRIADTTSTSYTFDAAFGIAYTYTVRAFNGSVRSSYDKTGMKLRRVNAPKITGTKLVDNGVQISWGKVSGAERYRVYYKTAGGSWKKIGDTTSTQYTWRPEKGKKTTYSVTVRCITSNGKGYASTYDTQGEAVTYQNNQSVVEIDLTKQKLYFYKKGDLLLTSDLVSGCVAWGLATPTGTYHVYYKTRNAVLMNNAFVEYWMPFNGGIGLHDASWRNGKFGGDIYKKDGSHGCINLPTASARLIYNNISAGYKVYVHK